MSEKIKRIIKKIIPGFILRFVTSYRYGFFGPYKNWEEVKKKSTGYGSDLILEKVKNSLLKVKRGEAVYERDSIVFDKAEYSWPILAMLLYIASENDNKLNVLDFGGSLGSTYWQHRPFFKHLLELKWNIVEQPNFVACGKEYFSDQHLSFYHSIKECLDKEKPSAIIFSSVIEYLEKPYEILREVMDADFQYVIFDRTTFSREGEDAVTLQKVPPQVYEASYPCWFLSEKKLSDFLAQKYELLAEFKASGDIIKHGVEGELKGLFFKHKS